MRPLVLAVAFLCACATVAGPVSVREIGRGAYGNQLTQRFEYITDEATLRALWQDAPAVDFKAQAVIAVFMGQRRTGGYAIMVGAAERADEVLKVTVTLYNPGANCMTTQAFSQPWQFVTVPAGAKRAEFTTQVITTDCP